MLGEAAGQQVMTGMLLQCSKNNFDDASPVCMCSVNSEVAAVQEEVCCL